MLDALDSSVRIHTIPAEKIDSLKFIHNGGFVEGYQGKYEVNGLPLDKYITGVTLVSEANGKVHVEIRGLLNRLTEKEKRAWGIVTVF